ncbi:MAG: type II secretion system secretin GspD [Deltaproteobacteria bacterium]|nr:type II secretion system secretin GspD [Deltaproteobacteria bacterium]
MKPRQSHILLVLLLLVLAQGCAPQATRPWVDLKEINDQIVRGPAKDQAQEPGKEGAPAPPRIKDMSVSAAPGPEGLKDQTGVKPHKAEPADGILLNFDNADIYEFIQVISETLGINYIVDPKVKGTVNIHSAQKIGKDQLFGIFQKILHVNGLDVRNEGDYYSIHPSKGGVPQQIYGPGESGSLKASSRLVVQIIPVAHLASTEAQKLVEPYLSEVGTIYNLTSQNTLIVNDFESKVLDIVSVLSRLDVSPLAALKVRMIRVENAPLFTLRDELQEILTALSVNPKEHEAVSIIALERVNSLLLISKSEQLLDSTDRWIKELDVVPAEGRDPVYFYNVRNSVASELAALVNAFISGGEAAPAAGQMKSGLERETGTGLSKSTLSGGSGDTQAKSLTGPTSSGLKPDAGVDAAGAGKSESFGKTTGVARTGAGKRSGKNLASLQFGGEPSLLADDARNIVLIRAERADYLRVLKMLERLDNLPKQVLIEVMVAEVALNDSWEFGIEWALKNNKLNINGSKYSQYFSTTAGTAATSTSPGSSGLKSVSDPVGKAYGFAYSIFNSSGDIVGLLNAIAAQTDVSLLSSPQILVLNNEEAFVNVGDQVPIKTSESVPQDATAFKTSTIQYKDTGTLLKVRPRINHDGLIILDIDQQVSAATINPLGGTDSPIISTRQLKTKLAVKNGQSIMMGGLIKKGTTNEENKIPLLGDIPGVGWLFKYGKKSNAKTELLVMITPYVIESDDVLAQYIKKFQEKMQGLRQGLVEKQPAAAARPAARETLEDKREKDS